MAHTTFQDVKVDLLLNHRWNAEVFGQLSTDDDNDEFLDLVKTNGILEPLLVVPNGPKFTIISGHRRMQAWRKLGNKEIPCIIRRDLRTDEQQDAAWFASNRNREMTTEQRARWYEKRKAMEEQKAKERQVAAGGAKGGSACGTSATSAFSQGKVAPKAKDVAAADVGMGRKTAEKAAEVVHKIDEAEEAGDVETATELRHELNNGSVAAAHRKATQKAEPEAPSILKDGLGNDVPPLLKAKFDAAAAILATGNKLDGIKRDALKLADEPGGEFLDACEIERTFKTLKGLVTQGRYWSHCPRCSGKGCARCEKHGYVPHSRKGQLSEEDKAALGVAK